MYSVTCVGNRSIILIRFSSNVFKLIVITITSDVLIFLIIYLYAVFKVHKDASTWKTIVCDKLVCLSRIAFSCIGM